MYISKMNETRTSENNNIKIQLIGRLQNIHQWIKGELKENLTSPDSYKRTEFIHFNKDYPISIMDIQDIPESATDDEILLLIASFLDPEYENDKLLNPSRSHQHLFIDQTNNKPKASRSMMEAFEWKTRTAIWKLKNKWFKENHIKELSNFFPTDSDGNLKFDSFNDILNFIRKWSIKSSNKNSYTKEKNIYIVCSILKEMIRNQEFKNNRDRVRQIQEATHQFFHEFIRPSFPHWSAVNPKNVITDETNKNYTKDKYFLLDHNIFENFWIRYYNIIPIKMEYRAKTDESIKDKNMINPDTTTLSSIHDLWGVKFKLAGENLSDEDFLVTYYIMFKLVTAYSEKTHPDLHKIAPSWWNSFNQWWLYESHPEIITQYLDAISTNWSFSNNKTPLMKDKWFLPIKKDKNWIHIIDPLILKNLNINDTRFIYLLNYICEQKNLEFKAIKEKKGKIVMKQKKWVFHNIFPSIKNSTTIIDDTYEEKIWYFIQNYSKFEREWKKLAINQKKELSWIVIWKDQDWNIYTIFNNQDWGRFDRKIVTDYKNLFVNQRKELENGKWSLKNDSHKGNRPDAKISFVIYINWEPTNIERQVCKEEDIKNIPLLDEHSIYGPAKQLLVYWRYSSWILTLQDIEHIIDNNIIKVRNKDLNYQLENGLTYWEMIDTIEKDDTILPKNWSFREKLIYNFTKQRWLREEHWLYYTHYYENLKAHGLAL